MLPFAHIGIAIALFYIAGLAFPKVRPHINYWYVIVGSMLPDIIDKTVGMILFADTFANGRIFAHALLFVVVLGAAGYYFYTQGQGDYRVLTLAGASLIHQLLDSMWKTPVTFLWPLLGWGFERLEEYGSFWQFLLGVYGHLGDIGDPQMLFLFMTELLGLAVITIFGATYLQKRRREQKH
ncbi:MAG: metal-dependent hydrolase [Methanolobus sp.]|uniref:metal-dependent hydrolase n=1 Tax=Methanolobus sp. TaxID=1874737 RepID=UPI002731EF28|nr:metal-dependent hydrolase [Methanolobus sp.]MDP2218000.1 metal-dependent hydrolase [Methanolobus sp.]